MTLLRPQPLIRYIVEKGKSALASLGRVVVYGCPPLAILICNRVSLKSFPATLLGTEATGRATGGLLVELSGIG